MFVGSDIARAFERCVFPERKVSDFFNLEQHSAIVVLSCLFTVTIVQQYEYVAEDICLFSCFARHAIYPASTAVLLALLPTLAM